MELVEFEIDADAERSARNAFFGMSFVLVAVAAYQAWSRGRIQSAVTLALVTGQVVYWISVLVHRRQSSS